MIKPDSVFSDVVLFRLFCESHLLIQVFIALIQVFVLQAPFVLHMDVSVELPCQRLVQLQKKKRMIDSSSHRLQEER